VVLPGLSATSPVNRLFVFIQAGALHAEAKNVASGLYFWISLIVSIMCRSMSRWIEKCLSPKSSVTPGGSSSYDQNGRCSMRSGLPMVSRNRSNPAPCSGSTSRRTAFSRSAGVSFHRFDTLVSSIDMPIPLYRCRRCDGSTTTVASTARPASSPTRVVGSAFQASAPPVEYVPVTASPRGLPAVAGGPASSVTAVDAMASAAVMDRFTRSPSTDRSRAICSGSLLNPLTNSQQGEYVVAGGQAGSVAGAGTAFSAARLTCSQPAHVSMRRREMSKARS
jgi:hypothetical protein